MKQLSILIAILSLTLLPGQHAEAQETGTTAHTVAWGETLFSIAQRYSVSTEAIVAQNDIVDGAAIYAGQVLIIPVNPPTLTGGNAATYTVSAGDSLWGISQDLGVTLDALLTANNLISSSSIYPGQILTIPGSAVGSTPGYGPETATHVIQPGETLSSIARLYAVSMWTLTQMNNIANPSVLMVGDRLAVPAVESLSPQGTVPSTDSKLIVVDISDQRTMLYENGTEVATFIASTGMPGAGTAPGNYVVQNRIPMARSNFWNLDMPWWLGIYWVGSLQNGFHSLPILADGSRLWAGFLGTPVSYGCIIHDDADAQRLYNWAEVGTAVTIQH